MTLLDRLRAMPPGSLVPVGWLMSELEATPAPPGATAAAPPAAPVQAGEPEDHLLTVKEAARRLGVTKDWLYHHRKELPFAVKLGRKQLRFSAAKLERYLEARRRGTAA